MLHEALDVLRTIGSVIWWRIGCGESAATCR
jgi:hypothetical protein